MKNENLTYVIGILVFLISFAVIFVLANWVCVIFEIRHREQSSFFDLLFFLITIIMPFLISFTLARSMVRLYEKRYGIKVFWLPRDKTVLYAIICLYSITGFIGNPIVQSYNTKLIIDEYKGIISRNSEMIRESYPYLKTYVSFPIAPFVVVSYHEFTIAGLSGWDGWDIQIWYIAGVKRITLYTLGMS